jgi:GTP-sensing pleiotropic transcriptional regulator CodY
VWPQEDADDYQDLIAEGLLNIFNQYLTMRDGIQEKLFSSLTKTEEKALVYVLETIGEEGNISISTAIADSGISRPVFTSLFDKLDRYKGAEIKNQGVKGTYISFYDHVLSKFEIS